MKSKIINYTNSNEVLSPNHIPPLILNHLCSQRRLKIQLLSSEPKIFPS